MNVLMESKKDLIKPIFIQLCQENDELCNWVIKEQLLKEEFVNVKLNNIQFLQELI